MSDPLESAHIVLDDERSDLDQLRALVKMNAEHAGPVTPRHHLYPGSIDESARTAICSVCGPDAKITPKGTYMTKTGPRQSWRCGNYITQYRAALKLSEDERPPSPRKGRPRAYTKDVAPAPGITRQAFIRLSREGAARQHNKCALCGLVKSAPNELQITSTASGQRLQGVYCESCRLLFRLCLGSEAFLMKAITRLRLVDDTDHSDSELELEPEPTVHNPVERGDLE